MTQSPLAIVTGASSGIGRATAQRLAQRGYRVAGIARRDCGCDVDLRMDLTDVAAIGPAITRLMEDHGTPRVLVNAAGVGQYTPHLDTTMADERAMFDLLYHAPSAMIRAVLPAMLDAGRGYVINVCSISTRMGPWGHSNYAAAKSALVSLTQTLAAEHADGAVRFSYVNPGIIDTAFFNADETHPILEQQRSRAISPQRVARGIVGLLDRPRLALTVPASYSVLGMIAGCFPGLAHRMVAASSRPATTAPAAARRDGAGTSSASGDP